MSWSWSQRFESPVNHQQKSQNAAAHILTRTNFREHNLLPQSYGLCTWLPISRRIDYKTLFVSACMKLRHKKKKSTYNPSHSLRAVQRRLSIFGFGENKQKALRRKVIPQHCAHSLEQVARHTPQNRSHCVFSAEAEIYLSSTRQSLTGLLFPTAPHSQRSPSFPPSAMHA